MLKKLETSVWNFLQTLSPKVHSILFKRRTVIAFIFSGGAAFVTDTSTLYVCKDFLGMSLVPAVSAGFLVGFCVSFTLQKFWAFEDTSVDRVHAQATWYFLVALANYFVTAALMYVLVEVLHLWYIFSKLLVTIGIACVTFFIYRLFIFKRTK
ncbi:MAG: GtrA family protein [Patescibacteria group bacterium]